MEISSLVQKIQSWQQLRVQTLSPESWRVSGLEAGRARCLTLIRRPDHSWRLLEAGRVWRLAGSDAGEDQADALANSVELAPMEGILRQLAVQQGDRVKSGQQLYVLEAMKMQVQVCADTPGRIEAVQAHLGERVAFGQQILTFIPEIEDQGEST